VKQIFKTSSREYIVGLPRSTIAKFYHVALRSLHWEDYIEGKSADKEMGQGSERRHHQENCFRNGRDFGFSDLDGVQLFQ
jgi:hypothetical protein